MLLFRGYIVVFVVKKRIINGTPWQERKDPDLISQFLGFTFSWKLNRRISDQSIKRFKERIREITRRVRGRRIEAIIKELRQYM